VALIAMNNILDKKALRIAKNREAAHRSRQKKAQLLDGLKSQTLSNQRQIEYCEHQNLFYEQFMNAYSFSYPHNRDASSIATAYTDDSSSTSSSSSQQSSYSSCACTSASSSTQLSPEPVVFRL
jgi:hypothetical protein